jgi:MFS family permease
MRTRFFACRQRTSQICLLSGFVIGGLALQFGKWSGFELSVFLAIFLVAALCRVASGCFMARQSEPSRGQVGEEIFSLGQLFSKGNKTAGGSLVGYLLAMQVAVQISGPYFTPFMLKQEGWSYVTYMLLIGLSFLGKVLALPLWGRLGQRIGATRLMWVGGLIIVPISGFWLASDLLSEIHWTVAGVTISAQLLCIAAIQLLSGVTWAAYELAMALLFLHGIPRKQRTSMLTLYHFGNAAAMVAGALIGLSVFRLLGEAHSTYMTLFVLSSVMRLAMVPLLLRIRETPATPSTPVGVATTLTSSNDAQQVEVSAA